MATVQASDRRQTPPRLSHDTYQPTTGEGAIRRQLVRSLLRDQTAAAGLVIVLILLAVALLGPHIAPYDPLEIGGPRLQPPSLTHLFGTDHVGRDMLSRIIFGARLSLGAALVASVVTTLLGLIIGCIAGYLGGIVDSILMRSVDVLLAFPGLILALVIAGLFKPSLLTLMVVLAAAWWMTYARIFRGLVLSVRERLYVESAKALGAGDLWILRRHVVPNVISPVIVLTTLEVGSILLAISGLSFLGLGAQPPTPEWGAMLNDGRNAFFAAPHVMLFPGIAISLTVLGFNLLGDGLRDILDPRDTAGRRGPRTGL